MKIKIIITVHSRFRFLRYAAITNSIRPPVESEPYNSMDPSSKTLFPWREEEIVLLSALEHYSYCPRQCALIHVEAVFDENIFTLRGSNAHARADETLTEIKDGIRSERALPLWSDEFGLIGRGDVVEIHGDGAIIPVEYKHGKRRSRQHDDLQLCGQALCLEEMMGQEVREGAVYSIQTRRRRAVAFTQELRAETFATISAVRSLQASAWHVPLPPAVADARCPNCSLKDACLPSSVVAARETRLSRARFIPLTII